MVGVPLLPGGCFGGCDERLSVRQYNGQKEVKDPPGPIFNGRYLDSWNSRRWKLLAESFPKTYYRSVLTPSWLWSNRAWKRPRGACDTHRIPSYTLPLSWPPLARVRKPSFPEKVTPSHHALLAYTPNGRKGTTQASVWYE